MVYVLYKLFPGRGLEALSCDTFEFHLNTRNKFLAKYKVNWETLYEKYLIPDCFRFPVQKSKQRFCFMRTVKNTKWIKRTWNIESNHDDVTQGPMSEICIQLAFISLYKRPDTKLEIFSEMRSAHEEGSKPQCQTREPWQDMFSETFVSRCSALFLDQVGFFAGGRFNLYLR